MPMIDYLHVLTPSAQQFNATAVCTDTFPLTQAGREVGNGEPMAIVFVVTVAAAVAGSETYEFQAVSATASNGTSGQIILASSDTFTVSGGAIAKGSLAAGAQVVVPIPPGSIPATATHLTGKVVIGASGDVTCKADIRPLRLAVQESTFSPDAITYPTGG